MTIKYVRCFQRNIGTHKSDDVYWDNEKMNVEFSMRRAQYFMHFMDYKVTLSSTNNITS